LEPFGANNSHSAASLPDSLQPKRLEPTPIKESLRVEIFANPLTLSHLPFIFQRIFPTKEKYHAMPAANRAIPLVA